MTIIAAVATPTHVVMGCDSRADFDGTALYLAAGKIATFAASNEDTVLLGFSGAGSILAVLSRNLSLPAIPDDDSTAAADAWASRVAEVVTETLATATPPVMCDEGEGVTSIDGIGLLAWRQHLWLLQTHAAFRPSTVVHALGSGADLALGAMHVALETGFDAEKAVDRAVRLACDFITGCGVDDRGPLISTTGRVA